MEISSLKTRSKEFENFSLSLSGMETPQPPSSVTSRSAEEFLLHNQQKVVEWKLFPTEKISFSSSIISILLKINWESFYWPSSTKSVLSKEAREFNHTSRSRSWNSNMNKVSIYCWEGFYESNRMINKHWDWIDVVGLWNETFYKF